MRTPLSPARVRVALRRTSIALVVVAALVTVEERARTFSFAVEPRAAIATGDASSIDRAATEILDRAHLAAGFEGCALISVQGQVVAERCTEGRDLTPSSRFSIGSLEKQFTGLLVQELAQADALSLDDPIERHLPELGGAPVGRVTVSQLVHMTSGLPSTIDLTTNLATQLSSAARSDADFLHEVRGYALAFEPGTRDRYSNVGYGLLAILLGRKHGRAWRDVLLERFAREGMRDSGFMDPGAASDVGVVRGHVPLRRWLVAGRPVPRQTPQWNYAMLPGGGVYASVRDLYIWDRALRRIEVESPDLYRAFMEPSAWGYASGWFVSSRTLTDGRVVPAFVYSGEDPGYCAWFARFPHLDAAVIVLSSTDFTLARTDLDVPGALTRLALGEPYDVVVE